MARWSFTEHPASVGETYWQHMGAAFGFSVRMLVAGFACLIHGFLPFLFVRTGSQTIEHLHDRMVVHRSRLGTDSKRIGITTGQSLHRG